MPIVLRRGWRVRALSLALSLALTVAWSEKVSAHAYIVRTDPAIGAVLARGPALVHIWFDEPVNLPVHNPLVVRDARGQRVDRNDVAIDPNDATEIRCRLRPLGPGLYTVSWRVISADTHVVHGQWSFHVGAGSAPAPFPDGGGMGGGVPSPDPLDPASPLPAALRWFSLLGTIAAGGALLFASLVARLAIPTGGGEPWCLLERRARTVALAGCVILLCAAIPALVVQAADAAAVSVPAALAPAILGPTLTGSRWGRAWLVRVVLALVLIAAVARAPRAAARPLPLVAAALLLLTFSVSGHGAGYADPVRAGLAIGADWVHLTAAAAWLGGVAVLAAGLRPALRLVAPEGRRAFLGALIPRFSRVATVSVAAVIPTGIYEAWLRLPGWDAFIDSVYGRTLLIKIVLIAPLLALGGVNLLMGRGTAGAAGDPLSWAVDVTVGRLGGWPARVAAIVRGEAVLAVAVLAAVAVLVGQPPPAAETSMHMPMTAPPISAGTHPARGSDDARPQAAFCLDRTTGRCC